MAVLHLQNTRKISAERDYSVSLLSEIWTSESHTDTILYSDGQSVVMHSAFLTNSSELMRNLLASSDSKVIILPSFSPVLSDFVSLVYTGRVANLGVQNSDLLTTLCTELGMTTTTTVNKDNGHRGQKSEFLKLEAEIDNKSEERFRLRLPMSRIDHRCGGSVNCGPVFEGFKGRIQEEYNCSPVGPYEGPYDQDQQIPLFAQLSKSKLNYDKYTNFSHPEKIQCKNFQIKKKYEDISDLDKIETLEVVKNSSDKFVQPDDDSRVFYTCSKKSCMIPCPCNPCNSSEGQCPEHKIVHMDLFDENEHAISIRSTELSCCKENFFNRSYILKYPGIPKICPRCRKDLLHHKSYHLDFHWTCKFCKLYQYKLYPKTVKELYDREVKEKSWYRLVCPHCDSKFSEPYQRKKHIEFEHQNKKLKCENCYKLFQCMQSLEYHKLTEHTEKEPVLHPCDICKKVFRAKVTLDSHIKFKHSDKKEYQCEQCESKFKQKKNLIDHVLYVHGMNKRKEDYWQDLPRKTFDCETCEAKFQRKGDLTVHFKMKHMVQNMVVCDLCPAEFKYSKNLKRHRLEKHGSDENKPKCPDCGKLFNQKSNMERHQLSHRKN